jgi:hypothetical protein
MRETAQTQQEWPAELPLIKIATLVNGTFTPPELDYAVQYNGSQLTLDSGIRGIISH